MIADESNAAHGHAAHRVCARVQRWLEDEHSADVFFCDKEALDARATVPGPGT